MRYQGVRVERELPNDISAPRRPIALKSSSKRASRDSQDLDVRFRTSRPHDSFNTENNLRGVVDRDFQGDRPRRISAVGSMLLAK